MLKRIGAVAIALIMLFCVGACELNRSFIKYKNDTKDDLESYAIKKGKGNYLEGLWSEIEELVEEGKKSIDNALNKKEADLIAIKTKEAIDAMPTNFVEIAFGFFSFQHSTPWRPIFLWHPDENVVFECSVDHGYFQYYQGDPPYEAYKMIVKSTDKFDGLSYLHWVSTIEMWENPLIERVYIYILVKTDDLIIGYSFVEMYRIESIFEGYLVSILASELAAKLDGEYQNIPEEEIKIAFESIKNQGETNEN